MREGEYAMKQEKAYYHLPGSFEFYELYREFLPLFRAHREYFYDWCDIGSIYGTPACALTAPIWTWMCPTTSSSCVSPPLWTLTP